MNRSAARLSLSLVLIAALVSACSRREEPAKPSVHRELSAIWSDMLAQRDAIQKLLHRPIEEVTHEDCSALGAAARQIDQLTNDILAAVTDKHAGNEGQLRALGDVIIRLQAVTNKLRESALAEAPGQWPALAFPLDQTLRAVETYFTPEDLGGQSVAARPDFEKNPLPAPLSPI